MRFKGKIFLKKPAGKKKIKQNRQYLAKNKYKKITRTAVGKK